MRRYLDPDKLSPSQCGATAWTVVFVRAFPETSGARYRQFGLPEHTPRLENPKNDATDMAAALKQLGFEAAPTAPSRSLPLASLR